jgi:hypothetical protein
VISGRSAGWRSGTTATSSHSPDPSNRTSSVSGGCQVAGQD